jgi:hypothetical protein
MNININTKSLFVAAALLTAFAAPLSIAHAAPQMAQAPQASMAQTMKATMSGTFKGIEVNGGSVSFSMKDGKGMLSLSSDFKVPGSPAPHWQVVDAKGNTYLLKQLRIKGDMENRSVTLPSYIRSVKTVQIWCSFAEVNLGEASFAKAVTIPQR